MPSQGPFKLWPKMGPSQNHMWALVTERSPRLKTEFVATLLNYKFENGNYSWKKEKKTNKVFIHGIN